MSGAKPVPEISVVAPLWNEELNVRPLVDQVLAALASPPRSIELLLVDDASTDATWDRILEAQRADPRVRALRHTRNSGQSAALWTGFTASQGDIIATLDGDLQNDPADLPRLLERLASADLVCGVRAKRMDNALRRFSSAVARTARRAVLGVDFRDSGCNLRVFKRSVLKNLFPFDGLHRFMPILADGAGAVVIEMPVNHRPRVAGTSKYGVWNRLGRGICDLAMIAWYRKRQLKGVSFVEHPQQPGVGPAFSKLPPHQQG
jgi:dolichol-phosphate mannosyltransferase